jgi:hypothetical protein
MQVGKFLENIKHTGQNRCAGVKIFLKHIKRADRIDVQGGKFSGKSINVQPTLPPQKTVFDVL